jgi:hypothetical protein
MGTGTIEYRDRSTIKERAHAHANDSTGSRSAPRGPTSDPSRASALPRNDAVSGEMGRECGGTVRLLVRSLPKLPTSRRKSFVEALLADVQLTVSGADAHDLKRVRTVLRGAVIAELVAVAHHHCAVELNFDRASHGELVGLRYSDVKRGPERRQSQVTSCSCAEEVDSQVT